MRILRWTLATVLALWGVWNLVPIGVTAAYKAGRTTEVPPDFERLIPLMQAQPWWQLAFWTLEVALLLIAGWRLLKGRRALVVYAAAFAAAVANWWYMQSLPQYQQAFTAEELQMDYWILGGMAAAGALVWWLERARPSPPGAASA